MKAALAELPVIDVANKVAAVNQDLVVRRGFNLLSTQR